MSSRDKKPGSTSSSASSEGRPQTKSKPRRSNATTNRNSTFTVFRTKDEKQTSRTPQLKDTELRRKSAKVVEKSSRSPELDANKDLNEMSATNFSTKKAQPPPKPDREVETDIDGADTSQANSDTSQLFGSISDTPTPTNKSPGDTAVLTRNDLSNSSDDLPSGWEQHTDKVGNYFWHVATGTIQRTRPSFEFVPKREDSIVFYHDDEEINQAQKTSSDDDEFYESGAALTLDDANDSTFIVYPLGCCEFDETQLVSSASTKAIQKCILRLSNKPNNDASVCWGVGQDDPIFMKLFDDHIQFTDVKTRVLLRSQPIQTIKTWAVDDDNNFAFVVEDAAHQSNQPESSNNNDSLEYALLSEPVFICYVFRSVDDDDMSCKVAAKLNEEINRYKEHMSSRIIKSTRLQQMVARPSDDQTDADEEFDEFEASNELTMHVKYIGKTSVHRPTGIDVLNIAIDKCLSEASKAQVNCRLEDGFCPEDDFEDAAALTEAKLHVSPSSVIVESVLTGEIIVECRIRYLTFMGISRRDIRWCGFIMQNTNNKSFVAHCFECHPTAGHVCEAIQSSCTKMYEKVAKTSRREPEAMSIIPSGSKIRNTLAKTLSLIKLNPIP